MMAQAETESWRGCSKTEIYRNMKEFDLDHVEPVQVSNNHTVLYHCPIKNIPDKSPPRPLKANLKWDSMHVRLPCALESKYPVTKPDGTSTIESRWQMINHYLQKPITNSQELQEAICSYNSKYRDQWDFVALHTLFEEELDESERCVFFEDLLPRIIRLALKLPELIKAPIPLLKQGRTHSVTLSQQQISCLLANAFLCTFPRRNTLKRKSEYSSFPDINFNRLFQSSRPAVMEKIKCICHYFRRVCPTERGSANVPSGVVTFTRRSLEEAELPDWAACESQIGATPLHIVSNGTIEDQGLGLLQVDFANKFLGGGVLGGGCVQEEIRFVICPELLISKLFTECLRPTEALLMVGCERYSNYRGYASTFEWAGDYEDTITRDSSRRRMTHIVAIDALAFKEKQHQYQEDLMLRELNKAYTGFLHELESPAPGVASGNWGCGAFRGEARLKALLQLMACTVTKRPLVYFTFGDSELRDDIHKMHTFFIENNVRVCDLWDVLRKFKGKSMPLYEFIYKNHGKSKFGLKLSKIIPNLFTAQDSKSFHNEAATSGSTNQQVKDGEANKEISPSDGESDSSTDTPIAVDAKCVCPIEIVDTRITISDESEVDEIIPTSPETNIESDLSKTPPKQSTTRQRTLLEMLDQCQMLRTKAQNDQIMAEGSPAMKRHCSPKTPNQS